MTRARLPTRRGHEPVSFEHGGIAGIGRNGRLAGIFLNKRATGAEGAERWRLYSQELSTPIIPELAAAPERGPGGGELVARMPATPEPRAEVSGLPDWGRR
jgi:hypothetical protein